ncbi:MAG TPA: anthranilate phosphoribosyltransferase, partial [Spirochaetota bacterium]|nr:anthranilate phosphoribosyltransferase [Spirochaetota bacterium]
IISPGPGRPDEAGISIDVVKHFQKKIPILGICLGHQAIARAAGASIVKANLIYHGKTSSIMHDGKGVFSMLPAPLKATRYHSLVIDKATLPESFIVTAYSEDREIMAIRHKRYKVEGVQFHPESVASQKGKQLLLNFLQEPAMENIIKPSLQKLHAGKNLTALETEQIMNLMSEGKVTPVMSAAILTALNIKKETVEEITGFARIMREKATLIKKPKNKKVIDTCGTGGDNSGTFNISTIAAFTAAGAGAAVAKHGNRSITSQCGSADLLKKMGVSLELSPQQLSRALAEIGIAFLFAPRLHTSMKHIMPTRKELGIRTVFNILGPLTNPARADFQLLGVFEADLTDKMAAVLGELGIKRGMVVHGNDKLDEITLTGRTRIAELADGWIKSYEFDPAAYGFNYCRREDLLGGNIVKNTEIALSVLNGEKGPQRDIVIINAAAAIMTAELAVDFKDAVKLAADSLDSGKAMKKLDMLREFCENKT